MSPTTAPTRITIDFHDAIHPSRTWILGIDERSPQRLELIAFDGGPGALPPVRPSLRALPPRRATPHTHVAALVVDCACPDFCERDHANE
ncbi:MAG TPA: hypothetical protein VFI69_02785 [Candidatus Limnocylindrales bacterium]|jgi:hypothetical protein|nr:hypothetical protein [Candidatus Limnocylindrales bacterium]